MQVTFWIGGGNGTDLYLTIWHGFKWDKLVSITLPLLLGLGWITILLGLQLFISPLGQGFEYFKLGHLLWKRVVPLKSVSKSTRFPLIWLTLVPPTTPNSIRHLLQCSNLEGSNTYANVPTLSLNWCW